MTTIAFDGKIIAADRLLTIDNTQHKITKIHQFIKEGRICYFAIAGRADIGMSMYDWVSKGENPENFPDIQKTDQACNIIIIDGKSLYTYERTPFKINFEFKKIAIGSGSDVALYCLRKGKTAIEAVRAAAKVDIYTGKCINFAFANNKDTKIHFIKK